MANSDKNIVITPNRGSSTDDPKIEFSGANSALSAQTITARVYPSSNGTLSFEGSAGQLFSITNDLSGTLFSVNDISGIPAISVDASGAITLAQYGGNVGIGTSTTSARLDVRGTAGLVANLQGVVVDSSGNMGIGTSSPITLFDLGTNYYSGTPSTLSQAINKISLWNNGTPRYGFGISTGLLNITAGEGAAGIALRTGGVDERMRIHSAGNVSIGTTTNYSKLTVSGGTSTRTGITISDTDTASLMIFAGASQNAVISTDSISQSLIFKRGSTVGTENGTETMRIDGAGNVGINNNNPTFKLDVNGKIKGTSLVSNSPDNYYGGYDAAAKIVNPDFASFYGLVILNSVDNESHALLLDVYNSGYATIRADLGLTIAATGDIGINTGGTGNIVLQSAVSANSSVGAVGQVLTSQGPGASPTWSSATISRTSSTSSTSTLSWNSNSTDTVIITAQSGGLTINADSGSPYNSQRVLFSITTSSGGGTFSMTQGSAKAFRLVGVSLPSTLTTNNTLYLGCIYNSSAGGTGRWDVISIREGA